MRNLLCCLVLGVLFTACHKDGPYKGGDKDLVVPLDFNWKTLERQDEPFDYDPGIRTNRQRCRYQPDQAKHT